MHIIGRYLKAHGLRPSSNPLRTISGLLTSVVAALALSITAPAHATIVGHFDFTGAITNENFYGPLPPFLSVLGVAVGDQIDVQFDLVSGSSPNGISWFGVVKDIVVTDITRNAVIATQSSTDFTTYPGFSGSTGEYRWDTVIPGESPFTMTFWFRTATPGVVIFNKLPTTIDASQFDYLHEFAIYYNNGRNPTVLAADLVNVAAPSPVPEPGTLSLLVLGLSGLATRRGRNLFRRRRSTQMSFAS